MRSISSAAKIDLLLVLSLAFQKKFGGQESVDNPTGLSDLVAQTFSATNETDLAALISRASSLENIPAENFQNWQEERLEKLRRRGRLSLLDENINPSHLADSLSREPQVIQKLILKNLPPDLSQRIAFYLDIDLAASQQDTSSNPESAIDEEIVALIKRNFLSNFVSFDDIFDPTPIDKFSISDLEEFVYQLGLREVALACRGITSKETLAAFLNGFCEDDARRIAGFITELENVKPFWVVQADEIVRKSWSRKFPPDKVVKLIGLKLLAVGFAGREQTAQDYTAQKISVYDTGNWLKMVRRNEKILLADDQNEIVRINKRQKSLLRLTSRFVENGNLF